MIVTGVKETKGQEIKNIVQNTGTTPVDPKTVTNSQEPTKNTSTVTSNPTTPKNESVKPP